MPILVKEGDKIFFVDSSFKVWKAIVSKVLSTDYGIIDLYFENAVKTPTEAVGRKLYPSYNSDKIPLTWHFRGD